MPKDGELYVNETGGKQSFVLARMDLIPPEGLLLLAECLGFGAGKYGEHNWKNISINENLNHALVHILKWLSGDRSEPHLVNVLARVHFALYHAIQAGEQPLQYIHPDMLKEQANAEAKAMFDEAEKISSRLVDWQKNQSENKVEYIKSGQTDRM